MNAEIDTAIEALKDCQAAHAKQQKRAVGLEELLQLALSDLEAYELRAEGEWGSYRSLEEIGAEGDLPESIIRIRKALSASAQERVE